MSETDQINSCIQAFMEALRLGEAEKCASMYEENAVVMPPNEPPLFGRESIRQHLANLGSDPSVTAEALKIEVSGELAYDRSRVTWESNGKTKYTDCLDVFKKQDDNSWAFIASTWNSVEGFDSE